LRLIFEASSSRPQYIRGSSPHEGRITVTAPSPSGNSKKRNASSAQGSVSSCQGLGSLRTVAAARSIALQASCSALRSSANRCASEYSAPISPRKA